MERGAATTLGVQLPIYTAIAVEGYQMYPGNPAYPGIRHEFVPGLHLIAGVNGLGKSTFLLMLYHGLVGPAAIRNDDFGVPMPEVIARRDADRFRRRVADGAKAATVSVGFTIGDDGYIISRSLHDLSLASWHLNSIAQNVDEENYRHSIVTSMKVAGFADVLTILNLIVFMFEDRDLLMWSPLAQRNALRALFMSPSEASDLATRAQAVAKANSAYRNLLYIVNRDRKQLARDRASLAASDAHSVEYRTLQTAVSGLDARIENLTERRRELDEARTHSRETHEIAKYAFDELLREIEALKLARVASAFPSSGESGRYVLGRLIGDQECLACGAEDGPLLDKWAAAVATGSCIFCGADHGLHEVLVPPVVVDSARLAKVQDRIDLAKEALRTAADDAGSCAERHDAVQQEIDDAVQEKSRLESRVRQIAGKVPPSPHSLTALEQRLATQNETLEQLRVEQAERLHFPFRVSPQASSPAFRRRRARRGNARPPPVRQRSEARQRRRKRGPRYAQNE